MKRYSIQAKADGGYLREDPMGNLVKYEDVEDSILLKTLCDIREALGVGGKPMLAELPGIVKGMAQQLAAIEEEGTAELNAAVELRRKLADAMTILSELVRLKRIKEINPEAYQEGKEKAWAVAFHLVDKQVDAALMSVCQCGECAPGCLHDSDCSVHNEPAEPNGPCDCSQSGPKFYVHTFVCGAYSGAYNFDTREEAEADAADRKKRLGICGCRYVVTDSPTPPINGPVQAQQLGEEGE